MAVEKLIMMNVVGKNNYVDKVIKDILLFENVQIVDAYNEIENFRFSMNVTDKHMDEILGFSEVQSGLKSVHSGEFKNKIDLLKELFDNEYEADRRVLKEDTNLQNVIQTVNTLYDKTHSKHEKLKQYSNDLQEIQESIQAYKFLASSSIEMEKINGLNNFNVTLGTLSKENIARLKNNHENITAIVVHVGNLGENETYVVISPQELEVETKRILRSLNFHKLPGLKEEYTGKPADIVKMLEEKKEDIQEKVNELEKQINAVKNKDREESKYAYSVLHLYRRINEVKKDMAFSKEYFYFSGWIPIKLKEKMKNILSKYEDIDIMFNDNHDNFNTKPPTKLKNNWLFKPFEFFIKMYGIPSYKEVDPTPFMSITYLFLFGFMFGDLGQGFVFFLIGELLLHLKKMPFGGIISRLGISSMFFGLLYGSIFGFETVIPALWLKPFDNINTLLIVAIGIGVVFLTLGYIYGMLNNYKMKDYHNIVLGKNGLTGLVLYFCLLLVALALFTGNRIISVGVLGAIIVLAIVILFMKEPIINKLTHKKGHKLDVNFFVESFFEVFEILLSIFSNTLSFIRVGAFALNHVGLFIAFESLAHLIGSGIGSIIVYIIGNLFIIGLEGLIVGIQVLRLEYYELFSKYYVGGGEEFKSTKL